MEITNWYSNIKGSGVKNDKNFKNHYIKPNSMIALIGSTGTGKSNSIVEFLSRKNNAFYEIIMVIPATADEPLVHLLQEHIEGIQIIEDLEELPNLEDYKEQDKKLERLLIIDDILNLNKKQLAQISKWYCSARKFGFTVICQSQNYQGIPLNIRRNLNYIFLFRQNDANTINHILRTHSMTHIDKDDIKKAYIEIINEPLQFMLMDMTPNSPMPFRRNFLQEIRFNEK